MIYLSFSDNNEAVSEKVGLIKPWCNVIAWSVYLVDAQIPSTDAIYFPFDKVNDAWAVKAEAPDEPLELCPVWTYTSSIFKLLPLLKFSTVSAPALFTKCSLPSLPTYVFILEVSS